MKVLGPSDMKQPHTIVSAASDSKNDKSNDLIVHTNVQLTTDESPHQTQKKEQALVSMNPGEESQFFVTGVEVRHQTKQNNDDEDNNGAQTLQSDQQLLGEKAISAIVDKYKLVGVVDAPRTLTPHEVSFGDKYMKVKVFFFEVLTLF